MISRMEPAARQMVDLARSLIIYPRDLDELVASGASGGSLHRRRFSFHGKPLPGHRRETLSGGGVVCLFSAAQFHGITLEMPAAVWMAVPRNAWVPRPSDQGSHAFYDLERIVAPDDAGLLARWV